MKDIYYENYQKLNQTIGNQTLNQTVSEIIGETNITQSDFFTKIINPLNVIGQFSDFNYEMMASYLKKSQSEEMNLVDDIWDDVMERSEKFEPAEEKDKNWNFGFW